MDKVVLHEVDSIGIKAVILRDEHQAMRPEVLLRLVLADTCDTVARLPDIDPRSLAWGWVVKEEVHGIVARSLLLAYRRKSACAEVKAFDGAGSLLDDLELGRCVLVGECISDRFSHIGVYVLQS